MASPPHDNSAHHHRCRPRFVKFLFGSCRSCSSPCAASLLLPSPSCRAAAVVATPRAAPEDTTRVARQVADPRRDTTCKACRCPAPPHPIPEPQAPNARSSKCRPRRVCRILAGARFRLLHRIVDRKSGPRAGAARGRRLAGHRHDRRTRHQRTGASGGRTGGQRAGRRWRRGGVAKSFFGGSAVVITETVRRHEQPLRHSVPTAAARPAQHKLNDSTALRHHTTSRLLHPTTPPSRCARLAGARPLSCARSRSPMAACASTSGSTRAAPRACPPFGRLCLP